MKTGRRTAVWNVAACGRLTDVATEDRHAKEGQGNRRHQGRDQSHTWSSHTPAERLLRRSDRLSEYWTHG